MLQGRTRAKNRPHDKALSKHVAQTALWSKRHLHCTMCKIHSFLEQYSSIIHRLPMISSIIRFLPGLIAAIVGFIVLKAIAWMSVSLQFLLFLAVYLLVAVLIDQSFRKYGKD